MNFDDLMDTVLENIAVLARNTVEEYRDHALEDAKAFLEESNDNLKRWTAALASGDLSRDDFTWLLKQRADLAHMHALTSVGITQARIKRFRDGVISVIVNTVTKAIL